MYDIPTYYPYTAQKKYLLRRSYCHRGMFQDPAKLEYIWIYLMIALKSVALSLTIHHFSRDFIIGFMFTIAQQPMIVMIVSGII